MENLKNLTLKELVTYNTNQYKLSNYGKAWMSNKTEKAYKNFSDSKRIIKLIRNYFDASTERKVWNTQVSEILKMISK